MGHLHFTIEPSPYRQVEESDFGENNFIQAQDLETNQFMMALRMSVFVIGLLLITVGVDSRPKSGKLVKKLARSIPMEAIQPVIPPITPETIKCVKKCITPECLAKCPPVAFVCLYKCDPGSWMCAQPCLMGKFATE